MKWVLNKASGPILLGIILSNIASFFLGGLFVHVLTKPQKNTADVVLQPIPVDLERLQNNQVYASVNGKRYYPWWCDAGKSIVPKNIIWFDSPEEAEEKGYTVAKLCT